MYINHMWFKIDLIVWKFRIYENLIERIERFKIDLIVWKY